MRKQLLLLTAVVITATAISQNPGTVFTIPNKTITLPCGTNCTSINVSVPHIKQSTTYTVTNPAYKPYAYATTTGTELVSTYFDDQFSERINLPFAFSFCFYGTTYTSLSVGSNGTVSFDPTIMPGDWNEYDITGPLPNTELESAAIFGPMHDIDPRPLYNPSPTQRRIEWRVEGNAPYRRFIASYNSVAYYGDENLKATQQIVIYENTGIIEVYIKDKPVYIDWNNGLAVLGVQNQSRTQAVTAPGKNATVWGTTGMDSCFRFIPSGGAPTFKRAQLLVNNVVVATNTTDTSTASAGVLNLNFPNVCPTADSTAYAIRVFYGSCSNPALDVSFTDTVYVKRNTLAATSAKQDATCTANGTITVTATGGVPPIQYSISGGGNYQATNVFSNLQPGTYTVTVSDAASCAVTGQPLTIALQGAVSVNAGADTLICTGASFTRGVTSNATTYSWSPAAGVSNPAIANPVLSPQTTTTYTVTATTGNCTAQDIVTVNVAAGASAYAGADKTILAGKSYQLQGTASAGTYLWAPPAGLSATNVLNPTAIPAQTTTYTLKVTTSQGCIATDDMTITVVPYCIKPMEAFTPNGDGINDVWLVTNGTGCLDKAKAQVFNRYGAKIFESNDYKNNWDGTYKGKMLPDGTYYFVITYRLITGAEENMKGSVTILR
jgi:gliding motility-associated-like protein